MFLNIPLSGKEVMAIPVISKPNIHHLTQPDLASLGLTTMPRLEDPTLPASSHKYTAKLSKMQRLLQETLASLLPKSMEDTTAHSLARRWRLPATSFLKEEGQV